MGLRWSVPRTAWGAALVALAAAVAGCSDSGSGPVVGGDTGVATDMGRDTTAADTGGAQDTGAAPDTAAGMDTGADAAPDAPARCASNAQCAGDPGGPACDTVTGRCVACAGAGETCPPSQHCSMTMCVPGCRSDEGCRGDVAADGGVADGGAGRATRCDVERHTCVECVTDEHCPSGQLCVGNVCVAGCTATRPCPSGQTCCTGACVDTLTNVAHCGACDARCAVTNGMPACMNGTCAVGSCTAPNADCDRAAGNGCETNTLTDLMHCGGCGTACAARPNARAACGMGRCEYTCNAGFADCDGDPTNGCEVNLGEDTANCGRCGTRCNPPNGAAACRMGACAVAACDRGFGDCDTNPTNGCEVDTQTTVTHCGMCGNACPARPNAFPGCVAGGCVISCVAGFADCDGNPTNGCEADTRASASHCGACNRECAAAHATPACAASRCVIGACDTGFADCNASAGDGCEVNTRSDVAHCGGCAMPCAVPSGTPTCAAGRCAVATCAAGRADCNASVADGCEVDTTADVRNCGGCGTACELPRATPACAASRCAVAACEAGYADCNAAAADGCEVDTRTSAAHCGACGRACRPANAAGACRDGACGIGACDPGFADCDMNPANGCEVDTRVTLAHCGACGRVCATANATPACAASACAVGACNAGFGDCNASAGDGCETTFATDNAHCGRCGNACAAGSRCVAGACTRICNAAAPRVLIYGPTYGTPFEGPYLPSGSVVTVASDAMWRSMTTADFARYNLIMFTDNSCSGPPRTALDAAFATRATWGAAVTGRVLASGQDPGCHNATGGAQTYMRAAFRWLTTGPGTGLYVTSDWNARRDLDYLQPIATGFMTAYEDAESVAITMTGHPVMAGSTNSSLSGWGNSYHSYFRAVPAGFVALATISGRPTSFMTVARDAACVP